jgi:hypothetical protein
VKLVSGHEEISVSFQSDPENRCGSQREIVGDLHFEKSKHRLFAEKTVTDLAPDCPLDVDSQIRDRCRRAWRSY